MTNLSNKFDDKDFEIKLYFKNSEWSLSAILSYLASLFTVVKKD